MTVAIVYATTHGHTGKIADHIADVIRAEALDVEVADLGERGDHLIRTCDAVIMAGSVHRGSHQPELVAFVRRHRHLLQARPSAFVSVSLTAADDEDAEMRAETRRMVDEFVEDTGWTPDRTATVAGAFQFSRYSPFERLVMRLIARQHETEIDSREDLELTDWEAVDQFTQQFVRRLR
jgi:menaquinone-dependent protoporphyrinogen oxidase